MREGRAHDPIEAFAARLKAAGLLDESGRHAIEEQVERDVDAAVKFAEESPFPSVEEFMSDLYGYVYVLGEAAEKGGRNG